MGRIGLMEKGRKGWEMRGYRRKFEDLRILKDGFVLCYCTVFE